MVSCLNHLKLHVLGGEFRVRVLVGGEARVEATEPFRPGHILRKQLIVLVLFEIVGVELNEGFAEIFLLDLFSAHPWSLLGPIAHHRDVVARNVGTTSPDRRKLSEHIASERVVAEFDCRTVSLQGSLAHFWSPRSWTQMDVEVWQARVEAVGTVRTVDEEFTTQCADIHHRTVAFVQSILGFITASIIIAVIDELIFLQHVFHLLGQFPWESHGSLCGSVPCGLVCRWHSCFGSHCGGVDDLT